MVAALNDRRGPFGLLVTGEAESWQPALEQIVGPEWLRTYRVNTERQVLQVVQSGMADAAVLAEPVEPQLQQAMDVLHVLRLIRRVNAHLPVVIVASRSDRRWLEDALRLAAFSVVTRPLALEELLRQIWRMMARMDTTLRQGPEE
jgi:DNA-binding NtrC family response regulator